MIRNLLIFLGTFATGALIALVARAAMFKPHGGPGGHPANAGEYAAMVSNPLVPSPQHNRNTPRVGVKSETSPPPGHAHSPVNAAVTAATGKPVNSVCSICGMAVDANLPTVEYQGQTIGFGCRMCPPKFKADPERYGPIYLRNEIIKR
jgi:YHS domain-containing protein